jgi:hypothetical protein
MQALFAAIGGAVMWALRSGTLDVLLSLGVGVAAYTGVDTSLGWLKAQFVAGVGGLPSQIANVLSFMKIGIAFNIILSAITMRMTMNGLASGAFKRWRVK